MSHALAVIADDFTGALDSGVQFVHAGLQSEFILQELRDAAAPVVRVFTTDSRNIDEAAAIARTQSRASSCGRTRLFKKIDSTMRGHVGAEIEALLAAHGLRRAVLCPAAPDAGRTVEHGRLRVGGVALHETAFADDPHWPARTCMIADLLRRPVTHFERVTAEDIVHAPTSIVSVDARTNADLAAIAHAAHAAGALPCGSLGLARAWAHLFARSDAADAPLAPHRAAPTLIVSGSRHPNSHAQIARLAAAGAVAFTPQDDVARMRNALAAGRAVVLAADHEFVAGGVTAALAVAVTQLVNLVRPGTLILVGGETAAAVCTALAVAAVRIDGEVEVGMPWGTIIGGAADGATIVTKAGGFGGADALVRFVNSAGI